MIITEIGFTFGALNYFTVSGNISYMSNNFCFRQSFMVINHVHVSGYFIIVHFHSPV